MKAVFSLSGITQTWFLSLFALALSLNSCTEKPAGVSGQTSSEEVKLFEIVDPGRSGVTFNNAIKETYDVNYFIYDGIYYGTGVAAGDINNDGLPDLFFSSNQTPGALYLNKGNMKFKDITSSSGLDKITGWCSGVTMADVNGDGYTDIYVCRRLYPDPEIKKNLLYINNGNNTFTEKAEEFGLADPGYSFSANFFDYDRDGDLDCYVVNQPPNFAAFRESPDRSKVNFAYSDRFYRNDGNNTFTDITQQAGLLNYAYGLSATIGDVNQDGWMDIYVTNDYTEGDYFYINLGNGTFTNVALLALKHTPNFSMGSDIADFNNDGYPDIFVTDMVAEDNYRLKANMSGMNPERFWSVVDMGFNYQYMFNALQMNNGNGTFSEIAQMSGVSTTDWSSGPIFADFDNDGFRDLYVTNGIVKDIRNSDYNKQLKKKRQQKIDEARARGDMDYMPNPLEFIAMIPSNRINNYVYKNNGNEGEKALTFTKMTDQWGLNIPSFSFGVAYADLDGDGDLDLVTNNMEDPAFIFENKANELLANNYINLRLKGNQSNKDGIGAKVLLKYGGKLQVDHMTPVRGFMSSVEPIMHFGLGSTAIIDTVRIDWPDGTGQILTNVKPNQDLILNHSEAVAMQPIQWIRKNQYFTNITGAIDKPFVHQENEYDDYAREVLIPHKMSELGPCLATGDVNGDKLDDFFVGGASGQSGELYVQISTGQYILNESLALSQDKKYEDMAATFFDADNDGDVDLYVGSGGNEHDPGSAMYQDRLYLNDGNGKFSAGTGKLPMLTESTGCVKSADFDNDGDMDLFVGGRQVPGKYAWPANSRLLVNQGGAKFTDRTAEMAPELMNLGMVTDAVWTDLNGDSKTDLMIVGEWMPVTVFVNTDGTFVNKTADYGLAESTGWWNRLASADMDNDGDMDFVIGNLGYNIKYKASPEEPFGVHSKDFDGNGKLDIVLSYYNYGKNFPVRGRSCSSEQIPVLADSFPSYHEFASSTLEEIYEPFGLEDALNIEAKQFASCYVENKGNGTFEFHPLPNQAQIAPTNGIIIGDFNTDQKMDVIIAGNHYDREIETTRSDAGIGLLMFGDGAGNFKVVPPYQSGISIAGDVKEIALVNSAIGSNPVIIAVKNDDMIQAVQWNGNAANVQVSLK